MVVILSGHNDVMSTL